LLESIAEAPGQQQVNCQPG